MPRKPSDTAEYFPHYIAKEGQRTLFMLEGRYGNDGYAFWFKLLEMLCDTDGHYIEVANPLDFEFLCQKCRVSVVSGTEMMQLLVDLGNVDRELWENGVIWVQSLVDNLGQLYAKRKRRPPQKPVFSPEIQAQSVFSSQESEKDGVISPEIPQRKRKRDIESIVLSNGGGNNNVVSEQKLEAVPETTTTLIDPTKPEPNFLAATTALQKQGVMLATEKQKQECFAWIDDCGVDLVLCAINRGASRTNGPLTWGFVDGILSSWRRDGLKTPEMVAAHIENRARSGTSREPPPIQSYADSENAMARYLAEHGGET